MTIQKAPGRTAPSGLRLEPWGGRPEAAELGESLAAIANACNRADGVDEHVRPDSLANWLSTPGTYFDARRDLLLARLGGELVAYGWIDWVDTNDDLREYHLGGYVHPEHMRRGIGTALLARQERHARGLLRANPGSRPAVYGSWCHGHREAKRALLERHGYQVARWFVHMLRQGLEDVSVTPLPDGLEIRPADRDEAMLRKIFEADVEAFLDHWGGFGADEARFREWIADPDLDPALFVVAWDGDQVAGAVINTIYHADNEAYSRRRGWLDSVFVRRSWRRRGLATALVARSLAVLGDRGMSEAMLGVDSDNPNGALGLYERAGFRVESRAHAFRKPMKGGADVRPD